MATVRYPRAVSGIAEHAEEEGRSLSHLRPMPDQSDGILPELILLEKQGNATMPPNDNRDATGVAS